MLFYYLLSLFKFIYLLTYFNISGGLCYQEETWCHRDMALHTLQGGRHVRTLPSMGARAPTKILKN